MEGKKKTNVKVDESVVRSENISDGESPKDDEEDEYLKRAFEFKLQERKEIYSLNNLKEALDEKRVDCIDIHAHCFNLAKTPHKDIIKAFLKENYKIARIIPSRKSHVEPQLIRFTKGVRKKEEYPSLGKELKDFKKEMEEIFGGKSKKNDDDDDEEEEKEEEVDKRKNLRWDEEKSCYVVFDPYQSYQDQRFKKLLKKYKTHLVEYGKSLEFMRMKMEENGEKWEDSSKVDIGDHAKFRKGDDDDDDETPPWWSNIPVIGATVYHVKTVYDFSKKDMVDIVERYFKDYPTSACCFLPIDYFGMCPFGIYDEEYQYLPTEEGKKYYSCALKHLAMGGCPTTQNVEGEIGKWWDTWNKYVGIDEESIKERDEFLNRKSLWEVDWKGKFLPGVAIDPRRILSYYGNENVPVGDPHYKAFIETCFNDLGGVVAKIYCSFGFLPNDVRIMECVWKPLANAGIPVITHGSFGGIVSSEDYRDDGGHKIHKKNIYFNDPRRWYSLLDVFSRREKKLNVCFAHFGGSGQVIKMGSDCNNNYDGLIQECREAREYQIIKYKNLSKVVLHMILKFKNAWTDISYNGHDGHSIGVLNSLLWAGNDDDMDDDDDEVEEEEEVKNKVMYGTDYWINMKSIKPKEYFKKCFGGNINDDLTEFKDTIARRNCLKFLGLEIEEIQDEEEIKDTEEVIFIEEKKQKIIIEEKKFEEKKQKKKKEEEEEEV